MPKFVLGLGYTTDPAHQAETLRIYLQQKLDNCRGWRTEVLFLTEDREDIGTMRSRVESAYKHALKIQKLHPHVRLWAYHCHCSVDWETSNGSIMPAEGFITVFLSKSGVVKQTFTPVIAPEYEAELPSLKQRLLVEFKAAAEHVPWGKKTAADERFITEIANRMNTSISEFIQMSDPSKASN